MNLQWSLTCLTLILLFYYSKAIEVSEEFGENAQVAGINNTKIKVAIIGGGFAGLAAYKTLQPLGLTTLDLFEASDRLGGRVYPIQLKDGYLQQGAEFIYSQGNPVYEIAERLNLINDSYKYDSEILFESVEFKTRKCDLDEDIAEEFKNFAIKFEVELEKMAKDERNWKKTIGELYRNELQKFIEKSDRSNEEINQIRALSEFYKTYYETDWNAAIDKISLKNLNIWNAPTENKLIFSLNRLGYKAILDELTKNLPHKSVHLSSKITLIDYSGDKTKLKTNDTFYETEYDYLIVTVSLGHLKAHATKMFEPKLPQQKTDVIEAMGFGSLLKIFLVYEKPFWVEDGYETSFVPLQIDGCSDKNAIGSALLSIEAVQWKPNVLILWIGEEAQKLVDTLSDDELSVQITQHFKATYINATVVPPKRIIRKSWLKDDNFLGGYSFITPEAVKFEDPFKLLAKPVYDDKKNPRILFAGEATHSQMYQTTIGAYLSGQREAKRLLKLAK